MLYLQQQIQSFHFLTVLRTGCHNIDSGSIDTAVSEDISQLGDIFFYFIESSCKKFPSVVGIYFIRIHTGSLAETFHLSPDIAAVHWLSVSGAEDDTASYLLFLGICQKQLP